MSLSIFDIPHLKDNVTQYFSTHELVYCVLVSKQWLAWFTPTLWSSVNTSTSFDAQVLSALERNRLYVRSITNANEYLKSTVVMPTFPNLRSLDYTAERQLSDDANIFHFLSTTQLINEFIMTVGNLTQDYSRRLITLLASQSNLRRLDLTIRTVWDPAFVPQLLHACRCCDSLQLSLYNFKETYPVKSQQNETVIEHMQDTRLRELNVRFPTSVQWPALPPLLQHCPLLERLEIRDLNEALALDLVSRSLRDGVCPRLKHLRLSNAMWYGEEEDISADILRAIGQEHGKPRTGDDGAIKTRRSLESFEACNLLRFTAKSAQALKEFHAETLTVLDLTFNFLVQFPLFVDVASSLPNLVSLSAAIWLGPSSRLFDQAQMKAALQSSWSCTRLKTIQLWTMYQHEYFSTPPNRLLIEMCAAHLFDQIGRQAMLQELKLEGNVNNLEGMEDYLTRLSSLKQLRCFELNVGLDFPLGEKEAEWIVLNWPRLIRVKANLDSPWGDGFILPGGLYGEFKTTLLAKRPWIQID